MCCDSGVIPRAINIRENDSIIGLAYSFIRNNHHKVGTYSCIYREKKRKKSSYYHHNY